MDMSMHVKPTKSQRQRTLQSAPATGGVRVNGDELLEAMVLAADTSARSKDHLLLVAKCLAGYAKAKKFSDTELRGISWFAHLPELPTIPSDLVFDEADFRASGFWAAWGRDPDAVLRLTKLIRDRLKESKGKSCSITSHLTAYSDTKAAAWKRRQRALRILKPPKNVEEFAAGFRLLNRRD